MPLRSRLLLISALLSLLGCAKLAERPPRFSTTSRPVERHTVGPERAASNAIIEEGKLFLDQGSYDRASDKFQEAATVDGTNGVAFYYLALVKHRSGEYGAVWDFLEKAEALLKDDLSWAEPLEKLEREVSEVKPRETLSAP